MVTPVPITAVAPLHPERLQLYTLRTQWIQGLHHLENWLAYRKISEQSPSGSPAFLSP